MNISSIKPTNVANTTFKCNCGKPDCQNPQVIYENPSDSVELQNKQKKPNIFKRAFKFVKNNKTQILTVGRSSAKGLVATCTTLGANQILSKFVDTAKYSPNLISVGVGIGVLAGELIKNRKVFKKAEQQQQ